MALFSETFNALADDETISTSNTGFTSISGAGTADGDTGFAADGAASARLETTAAGDLIVMEADYGASDPSAFRMYFRPDAYPGGAEGETNIAEVRNPENGIAAMMEFTSGGNIAIKNSNVRVATSTTALPVDDWTRIEWKLDFAGRIQRCRLFVGTNLHATSADEEIQGDYDSYDDPSRLQIGNVRDTAPLTAWWDEVAVDVDWIGPAAEGGGNGSGGDFEFTENFEQLANGTAVSETNTGFTAVAGVAFVADTAEAAEGSVSAEATVDSTQFAILERSIGASVATRYWRWYYTPESLPSGNQVIAAVQETGTQRADLRQNSDGTLSIRNGFTAVATTTTALSAGTGARLGWRVDNSAGVHELRLFVGANVDGTTPDETITDGGYAEGTVDEVSFGVVNSGSAWTQRVDAIAEDDAAYPGPAETPNLSGVYQLTGGELTERQIYRLSGGTLS